MDTIHSFKGYGKVDPVEEQAFRRKSRKRLIILLLSLILLIAVIIGAVTATVIRNRNNNNNNSSSNTQSASQSLKAVCSQTPYPESCYSSISDLDKSNTTTDPEQLLKLSLQVVFNSLSDLSSLPQTLMKSTNNETLTHQALTVCATVLDDALEYLRDSISSMDADDGKKQQLLTPTKIDDLKTWLSTALTNQDTCLDALEDVNSTFLPDIKSKMQNSTHYASNSLAIVSKISGILAKFNLPIHRKLLTDEFPEWVSPGVRRLLQAGPPVPNVTVALDGTGDVKTIKEAMSKVPKKSNTLFVIYIKEGVYLENVVLDKSFWNVMIYGDGKNKSIVSAGLNFIDGTPTFSTATFGNLISAIL